MRRYFRSLRQGLSRYIPDRGEFKLALRDDEKTLEALVNRVRGMAPVHASR